MHEIELDAESAELFEGSCSPAFDAIARLYDELASQPMGSGCLRRLSEPEGQEMLPDRAGRARPSRLPPPDPLTSICTFKTGEIESSEHALTSGTQGHVPR